MDLAGRPTLNCRSSNAGQPRPPARCSHMQLPAAQPPGRYPGRSHSDVPMSPGAGLYALAARICWATVRGRTSRRASRLQPRGFIRRGPLRPTGSTDIAERSATSNRRHSRLAVGDPAGGRAPEADPCQPRARRLDLSDARRRDDDRAQAARLRFPQREARPVEALARRAPPPIQYLGGRDRATGQPYGGGDRLCRSERGWAARAASPGRDSRRGSSPGDRTCSSSTSR